MYKCKNKGIFKYTFDAYINILFEMMMMMMIRIHKHIRICI
jgi:hypothetical protein